MQFILLVFHTLLSSFHNENAKTNMINTKCTFSFFSHKFYDFELDFNLKLSYINL